MCVWWAVAKRLFTTNFQPLSTFSLLRALLAVVARRVGTSAGGTGGPGGTGRINAHGAAVGSGFDDRRRGFGRAGILGGLRVAGNQAQDLEQNGCFQQIFHFDFVV